MAIFEGKVLLFTITALSCMGFMLIGYDNGLSYPKRIAVLQMY